MIEGIYINKNGEDIVEIPFKSLDSNNTPVFFSDVFYGITKGYSFEALMKYFEENYLFCCEV
jgi:hypothetical protein